MEESSKVVVDLEVVDKRETGEICSHGEIGPFQTSTQTEGCIND